MATKFITIRIPIPTISWGAKKEEIKYETTDWIPARVADIKSRIAAVESSLGWTKKPKQVSKVSIPRQTVHERGTESRSNPNISNAEDLKAKLLGLKK